MTKLQETGFTYRQDGHAQAYALYPWDPHDPINGSTYRDLALRICNDALALSMHKGAEPSVLAIEPAA